MAAEKNPGNPQVGQRTDKEASRLRTFPDVPILSVDTTEEERNPAVVNLTTVIELDSGDRWVEIDSDAAARYCGGLTRTGIGVFYAQEGRMEGGHPRRWFVLVGLDEAGENTGKVGLCVLPDGVECANPEWVAPCHTTGNHNKNPYPEFADEIADLAEFTGLPIEPNYMGTRLMRQQAPSPRGPRV